MAAIDANSIARSSSSSSPWSSAMTAGCGKASRHESPLLRCTKKCYRSDEVMDGGWGSRVVLEENQGFPRKECVGFNTER